MALSCGVNRKRVSYQSLTGFAKLLVQQISKLRKQVLNGSSAKKINTLLMR
jgi:hypothetical protein